VLDKVLDHNDEAGSKISSVNLLQIAGARAVLSKLAAAVPPPAAAGKTGKKKKQAQGMGSAPNTPQASSGFNAASPM